MKTRSPSVRRRLQRAILALVGALLLGLILIQVLGPVTALITLAGGYAASALLAIFLRDYARQPDYLDSLQPPATTRSALREDDADVAVATWGYRTLSA